MPAGPGLTFALALGAGVACQLLARHIRIPGIVLLLGAGVALGPDALGVVAPAAFGEGLLPLVAIAVAIILFEGGLSLDGRRLRRAAKPVRRLITWGALITMLGAGAAAHFFLAWPPTLALLFGALVIVTGPTVIRPLLRNTPLKRRLATVLEAEGLLIDPVGAIIAAVVLQIAVAPELGVGTFASGASALLLRVAFGAAAGAAFGFALVALLRWKRAVPAAFQNLVALGGALCAFELCEAVLSESGILAVTVAGVVVGNLEKHLAEELGEFQEQLTLGLIGFLFVVLAADVRLEHVAALGLPGLLTVAALALAVRPAGVFICTAGSLLRLRERAFAAWLGPRGVVAAAVASLAAAALSRNGVPGGDELRALVFLTIALTVVVQGGAAPLVAWLLRVREPARKATLILGAEELGFALAAALGAPGRVVFADSNPNHCNAAQARGYATVFGDAFGARSRAQMQLERARAVAALTPNAQLNAHFAGDAKSAHAVPRAYAAIGRSGSDVARRVVEKEKAHVLFDGPKDVERWNVRLRHGQAEVQPFIRTPDFAGGDGDGGAAAAAKNVDSETPDPFVLLAVETGGRMEPARPGLQTQTGARAFAAVYLQEEQAAHQALAALGFAPAPAPAEPGA